MFPTCGINSYNFGRVLAQTVHYFWSYFKMTEKKEKVTFALPIGAMGNIAAGHLAKICGLPIARFVGSVNINDITHRVFSKGEFHIEEEMFKNLSEAINIQAPYNFERVLYWSSGIYWGAFFVINNHHPHIFKATIRSWLSKCILNSKKLVK